MKAKIKEGVMISQDHSVFKWPNCKWPNGHTKNPEMIFDVEWKGTFWVCICPGFGEIDGDYGNGSIFVHSKNGVIIEDGDEEIEYATKLINLVEEDNYIWFLLKIIKNDPNYLEFEVLEVTAWDEPQMPYEMELYLRGTIKWDGCSHIYFGNEDNDGYLHLCGKPCWDKHNKLMVALWEYASANIEHFDKDVAD